MRLRNGFSWCIVAAALFSVSVEARAAEPTGEKKPVAARTEKPKAGTQAPAKSRNPVREYVSGKQWDEPRVVRPGDDGRPPSDAVVLFDGRDLGKEFTGGDDWIIADGYARIAGEKGLRTKRSFGSCQLHVEWASPAVPEGTGQQRGNSGIYLMGIYEVQILDSYENETYFDGQAASIYKQRPPLVNVCRRPGEWQTYDIVFQAPQFDAAGKLIEPAYVTVLQNGVLVQNHFRLEGGTFFDRPPAYEKHPAKSPLTIQNHHDAVRFRNIWIREL